MLEVVTALAWSQHGAFSAAQAAVHGITRTWLSRHTKVGTLRRPVPGVYTLASAPSTSRQTHMVHVLAAGDGSLVTGDSALGLWCPELVLPLRPVLAVPRTCGYQAKQARLIRSSDLHIAKPGRIDGIPVVGVARALLDASIGRTPGEVVSMINACQRHSPIAFGALVETLDEHARRGRPGIRTFRAALGKLTAEIPDSEFERLALEGLTVLAVEPPRLHHVVCLAGEAPIELDLGWPHLRLDVELDGRDHFVRMKTARRDRQRDRLLQAAGYIVARYTWDDYLSDRRGMLSEIAAFVDQRRLELAPA